MQERWHVGKRQIVTRARKHSGEEWQTFKIGPDLRKCSLSSTVAWPAQSSLLVDFADGKGKDGGCGQHVDIYKHQQHIDTNRLEHGRGETGILLKQA